MNLRKVSIIGDGAVGSSIAFALALGHAVNEIVIVDLNRDKAEGDALDMGDGMSLVSVPKEIRAGGYEDIAGSHVVIVAAGAAQKPGETRLDLLKKNASIVSSVAKDMKPFLYEGTIVLVVSNPVDILTYVVFKELGIDPRRVFGSGTVLDTSRLKVALGEELDIDPRSIHSFVVGEHGDSEVALFSSSFVGGKPLEEAVSLKGKSRDDLGSIALKVKNAAYEIIARKGATHYAVAIAVARIVSSILNDENTVLTVSSYVESAYRGKLSDVYISFPSVVNGAGIKETFFPSLSLEEEEAVVSSGRTLLASIDGLGIR